MRGLPILALLMGCGTETIRFPPDLWQWETGGVWNVQESAIHLDTVAYGCNSEQTAWSALVGTKRSVTRGEVLFFTEDPEFKERHQLEEVDGPSGRDFEVIGLTDETPEAAQEDGVNSTLNCETDIHRVGVVFRMWSSGDVAGCAWSGPAHASLIDFLDKNQFNALGCHRFEM